MKKLTKLEIKLMESISMIIAADLSPMEAFDLMDRLGVLEIYQQFVEEKLYKPEEK